MFEWLSRLFSRPNGNRLSQQTIATLPPRKLLYRTLYSLPDAAEANDTQRAFVRIFLLDGEVRNGGFNQYYYNNPDEDFRAVETAFDRLGDPALAALVRQANACFETDRVRHRQRWGDSLKSFARSYADDPFREYDTAYFRMLDKGRYHELMAQFVRRNAADFAAEG